ncbi:hypothetical protein F5146DRAFT_1006417 [Armillaria mellea]|nr:hypothetical protein F5146DRAFT_1006417 [Armillaria mellea]
MYLMQWNPSSMLNFSGPQACDHGTPDQKIITFGDLWSLQCRHFVHSCCAYQLMEQYTTPSFGPRPTGSPPCSFPVTKVWHCPKRFCTTIYQSIYSHRSHGWTLAPDLDGQVQAMVLCAASPLSSYLVPGFAPCHETLEDLEELAIKLNLLHKGIRVRWTPTASPVHIEYATLISLTHVPLIVVSISSIVASLSGSVKNSRVIDALVAETLANRLSIPPQCHTWFHQFGKEGQSGNVYQTSVIDAELLKTGKLIWVAQS